jgi:hypothetical protein
MKSFSLLLAISMMSAAARGQGSAPTSLEGPPMTLGISPLRAEMKIGAGVETTQSVRISNTGQVPTQIRVTVSDWTLSPSGEQQFIKLGSGTWGCGSWLKANPMEFALTPAATELVRYTMKVPPAAPEGGYHCAIVFDTLPPPREQLAEGTGVVNLVRLVTTLYATVGNPPIAAKIKRLEMTPRGAGKKTSYEIVTEFANDGTTQYRVSGELQVLDAEGRVIRTFEYKSFPVLPGIKREAIFQIEDPLVPGQYLLRAVVDVGGKERLAAETRVNLSGG